MELMASNAAVLALGERTISWSTDDPSVTIPVPVVLSEGGTTLTAVASVYYCRTGAEALCFIGQFELSLPVSVSPGASNGELVLSYELPPA
jgi:hypothetical protein